MKRHGVNGRSVEDDGVPIVPQAFKDYSLAFVDADITSLPQMADEAAHRYLYVAIDRCTRWVYVRIYDDQTDASSTDFLRQLQAVAPMKIVKLLTDKGRQFTSKHKKPSGNHAVDRGCARASIEHLVTNALRPQANGIVARSMAASTTSWQRRAFDHTKICKPPSSAM